MPELTEEERKRLEVLTSQLGAYELRAEALRQQISALSRSLSELSLTVDTLKSLKTVEPEKEVMVSIGSGCFVHAKLKGDGKVVYSLGAGVLIEKTIDEAISSLEERVKELQEILQKTRDELEKVGAQAEEIRPELERLIQKTRE